MWNNISYTLSNVIEKEIIPTHNKPVFFVRLLQNKWKKIIQHQLRRIFLRNLIRSYLHGCLPRASCRRFVNTLDFKRSLTCRFPNLSQAERLALRNLRRHTDVVIKPADKGGAVVVWARPLYIQEAHKQLSDRRFYDKLSADPLQACQLKVKSTINDMIAMCALPPSAKNLILTTPHTSRFYLLLKIHKPNNADDR